MFLASLLGKPARGAKDDELGKLQDLVARLDDENFPVITGVVVRVQHRDLFVPLREVAALDSSGATLSTSRLDLRPFQRREGEVLLGRDLLDKKIVDLAKGRVARANDLILEWHDGLRVIAVDVGSGAVASRLGLGWLVGGRRREVPWEQVDVFASSSPEVKVALNHSKMARLHPSDLADIMDDLPAAERREIVSSLEEEQVADAIGDMDPRQKAALLRGMDAEDAADLLDEMDDDEAADVLGDMEPDEAEAILSRMNKEDADAVRALLDYKDNSAGGLMTTEFVAYSDRGTAGDLIETLRTAEWVPDYLSTIYLLGDDDRIIGVVTLRDLVVCGPETPVADLARRDVVTGSPDDSPDDVALVMARYNLFALPIVDENGAILGVVTVDDAMEYLTDERKSRGQRRFE